MLYKRGWSRLNQPWVKDTAEGTPRIDQGAVFLCFIDFSGSMGTVAKQMLIWKPLGSSGKGESVSQAGLYLGERSQGIYLDSKVCPTSLSFLTTVGNLTALSKHRLSWDPSLRVIGLL